MDYKYSKLNFLFLHLLFHVITLQSILSVSEPKVPCFFIFGDSLVDNGNNNYLNTTARVDFLPYGIDFPGGPTGRFTNGRNAVDIIAEMLGFDKFISPFFNATDEDFLRGVNYGSGGAGILDETGVIHGDVITFNEQLSNHETTKSRMSKLLGGEIAAEQYLSKCIYSVGMGNNDYLGNYLPQFHSSKAPYSPHHFSALLMAQYSQQLQRLYHIGARKVFVWGLGKLGCVPYEVVTYGATDGSTCVETSNNVVQLFNQDLKLLLNYLNTHLPSAKFVYTTDSSTATSYGSITNLIDPCCQLSAETGYCARGDVPCSNRDEYMFWDLYHPTEAANMISANNAYTDHISSLLLGYGDDHLASW